LGKLLEETSQTGRIESIDETVVIYDSLLNFVGKSVNIIIHFVVSRDIDAGNDIMICSNILLLSFDMMKDKVIFSSDGTLKAKEKLDINTYRWGFSYISN
jgi:hypothetical protein